MMNHSSDRVRFGIIGLGNMGTIHARTLLSGKITRAKLLSTRQDRTIELPIVGEVFRSHLQQRIAASPRSTDVELFQAAR